jgi:hypothetical protein
MRKYTNKALELIENEMISNESVVMMAMKYLSDDEVYEMLLMNEIDLEEE